MRICKGCNEPRAESSFVRYEYSRAKKQRTARVHGHCEVCREQARRIRERKYYDTVGRERAIARKIADWGMSNG